MGKGVMDDDAYVDRWRTNRSGRGAVAGWLLQLLSLFTTRDTRGYSPFSFLFSKSFLFPFPPRQLSVLFPFLLGTSTSRAGHECTRSNGRWLPRCFSTALPSLLFLCVVIDGAVTRIMQIGPPGDGDGDAEGTSQDGTCTVGYRLRFYTLA